MDEIRIPIKEMMKKNLDYYFNEMNKLYFEALDEESEDLVGSINKMLRIKIFEILGKETSNVDEIIIKEDYVKMIPERKIVYTLNGFKFLTRDISGEFSFETPLWIVREGHSIVNPRKKTVFNLNDGHKAITKLGLSVVGNKDFKDKIIDPEIIFHVVSRKLKKLNTRKPFFIELSYARPGYVYVDVDNTISYSSMSIKLTKPRYVDLFIQNREDETFKVLKTIVLFIIGKIEGGKELFEEILLSVDNIARSKEGNILFI